MMMHILKCVITNYIFKLGLLPLDTIFQYQYWLLSYFSNFEIKLNKTTYYYALP